MIVSMLSYRIIKHLDVIKNIVSSLLSIDADLSFNSFSFQQLKQPFSHRIIVTNMLATQTELYTLLFY